MSDPIRYNIKPGEDGYEIAVSLGGEWVHYSDYARLQQERVHDLNQIGGLQKENARLKAEVERLELKATNIYNAMKIKMEADEVVCKSRAIILQKKSHDEVFNFVIKKLEAENARLQAEVERLKAVSTIEQRTIQGLQQTPEWSEIARMTAYCRELEAENARLRASSFVTAVPVEQYERLRKAGDAMAKTLQADYNGVPYEPLVVINAIIYWRAANEGKTPTP